MAGLYGIVRISVSFALATIEVHVSGSLHLDIPEKPSHMSSSATLPCKFFNMSDRQTDN